MLCIEMAFTFPNRFRRIVAGSQHVVGIAVTSRENGILHPYRNLKMTVYPNPNVMRAWRRCTLNACLYLLNIVQEDKV